VLGGDHPHHGVFAAACIKRQGRVLVLQGKPGKKKEEKRGENLSERAIRNRACESIGNEVEFAGRKYRHRIFANDSKGTTSPLEGLGKGFLKTGETGIFGRKG